MPSVIYASAHPDAYPHAAKFQFAGKQHGSSARFAFNRCSNRDSRPTLGYACSMDARDQQASSLSSSARRNAPRILLWSHCANPLLGQWGYAIVAPLILVVTAPASVVTERLSISLSKIQLQLRCNWFESDRLSEAFEPFNAVPFPSFCVEPFEVVDALLLILAQMAKHVISHYQDCVGNGDDCPLVAPIDGQPAVFRPQVRF